jgi:hypothetical protein
MVIHLGMGMFQQSTMVLVAQLKGCDKDEVARMNQKRPVSSSSLLHETFTVSDVTWENGYSI